MEVLSPKKKEIRQLKQRLLYALLTLSPPLTQENELPPQHEWLSTRQLAEYINEGVYRARNLLLEMVANGDAIVSHGSVKNSLRWYPAATEQQRMVAARRKNGARTF
ncbi:hypothetical protein [Serratia rhizosphaerae]|uniref:FaeA-like protein n=1 Tax=Serratia rhizosphaerae TaxID=2597702 RepID=A0ABX6GLP4_9GAMM|nr:hypothetical protein [Serratia rhizosphaerae]QHA87181.1 hypothetical protein FO014_09635 [Serratia rhizosphaerae]